MSKAILTALEAALPFAAFQTAVGTGRSQFIVMSESQEKQMGDPANKETLNKSRGSTRADWQAQLQRGRPAHRRGGKQATIRRRRSHFGSVCLKSAVTSRRSFFQRTRVIQLGSRRSKNGCLKQRRIIGENKNSFVSGIS